MLLYDFLLLQVLFVRIGVLVHVGVSAFVTNELGNGVDTTGNSHLFLRSNGPAPLRAKKESGDGYKFGDISKGIAKRFTKRVEKVTGKEYEVGDLTRHLDKKAKEEVKNLTGKEDYEFGDLSRWADSKVKERVCEMTGKDNYQAGDLSKEILRRALTKEMKWDEVLMLMKMLLSIGASFSPVAGALPAKVLIDLLNYSIAAQAGEKVASVLTTELDRRMKAAVTGDPEYQLGDFTKGQILKFIGKDGHYEFGDITRTVLEKVNNDKNNRMGDFSKDRLLGDTKMSNTKDLELDNEKVLAELAAWDKAFKVEEKSSK